MYHTGGRETGSPFLSPMRPTMSDELTLLKEQADKLGLTYSNNIGVDALRKKVEAKLNGDSDENANSKPQAKAEETDQERTMRIRNELHANELKLLRCRITCLNPAKAELKGEFISVGNKYIGTIRKFVPFGEAGEAYHLPKILVDDLRSREFNQVKTSRNAKGQLEIHQRLVKEYSIVELEPLTEKELAELARMQAAKEGQ